MDGQCPTTTPPRTHTKRRFVEGITSMVKTYISNHLAIHKEESQSRACHMSIYKSTDIQVSTTSENAQKYIARTLLHRFYSVNIQQNERIGAFLNVLVRSFWLSTMICGDVYNYGNAYLKIIFPIRLSDCAGAKSCLHFVIQHTVTHV